MEQTGRQIKDRKRLVYMDSLKLLAALLVFSVHFLAVFAPGVMTYWTTGWSKYILYGFSGKLAVCFFFISAGIFAMKKVEIREYVIKRYLRFVVPILLVELVMLVLMIIFHLTDIQPFHIDINNQYLNLEQFDYKMFLRSIVFLDDSIVSTYWCNWQLFVGPVLLVILNGLDIKGKYILLFLASFVFFITGEIWYTLCVLGGALYIFMQRDYKCMHKWYIKVLLVVSIYFLIRHPETNWFYLLKGIACMALIIVIAYSPCIQKLLENKVLRVLNPYSLEIYLLHTPVNLFLVYFVYGYMIRLGVKWRVIIIFSYILSFLCTIILSVGLHYFTDRIVKKTYRIIKIEK